MDSEHATDIRIDYTAMALRELLMAYFKGVNIDRFVTDGAIQINPVGGRARYMYQRELAQRNQKQQFSLGNIPLFTVQKEPMKITFNQKTTKIHPAFKELIERVDKFAGEYLQSVERCYDANNHTIR